MLETGILCTVRFLHVVCFPSPLFLSAFFTYTVSHLNLKSIAYWVNTESDVEISLNL